VIQVTGYGSITPGRTYNIGAWIRKQNGANNAGWFVLGVEWYSNEAVTWQDKMPDNLPLNYNWTQVNFQVTAPPDGFNGPPNRVGIWLTRHTDADVWYDDISVNDVTPGPPTIARSPSSLSHAIRAGHGLGPDTFNVQNIGGNTLSYTITDNAAWLSVSPAGGSGTGEIDTMTVNYDVAGVSAGQHAATIQIADPAATNSPQTIAVNLTVYVPGDFNHDWDVDQEDFGHFQKCLTGEGNLQSLPECADAKLDADGDVGEGDFEIFLRCMNGPGVPAPLDCAFD
jgi:hypothetical protein